MSMGSQIALDRFKGVRPIELDRAFEASGKGKGKDNPE